MCITYWHMGKDRRLFICKNMFPNDLCTDKQTNQKELHNEVASPPWQNIGGDMYFCRTFLCL